MAEQGPHGAMRGFLQRWDEGMGTPIGALHPADLNLSG